jgi:hypothetical protein
MSPNERVDYAARLAFLSATTDVMKPAPIITLREILPIFSKYYSRLKQRASGPSSVEQFVAVLATATYGISSVDGSVEAAALENALNSWTERHGFKAYPWIRDAALCTLFHAGDTADNSAALQWRFRDYRPPGEINVRVVRKPREPLSRLETRFLRACKEQWTAYAAAYRFELGECTSENQSARWTALAFAGRTFSEIAAKENLPRKTVEKSSNRFRRRAGLMPPIKKDLRKARSANTAA